MTIRNIEKYIEVHRELYRHLDFDDDGVEVILKGHLLIEGLLEKILESSVQNAKMLSKANLSHYKLACLVQAIHDNKCKAWVWKAVFDLNSIRNKLSHKLEYPGIEDIVEDFIELVRTKGNGTIEVGNEFNFSELSMAILNVHSELWHLFDELVA